jgi:hypothetical protein
LVGGRCWFFLAQFDPLPRKKIQVARVLVLMAIQAQQLPVATIEWIVIVVVVFVMDSELVQVFMGECPAAASTDPGIDIERLLPISLQALISLSVHLGNDLIQCALI